jgi:hypothetical protein
MMFLPIFLILARVKMGEEAGINLFLGFPPAQDKVGQRPLYHFVYLGRYLVDVTFVWQCNICYFVIFTHNNSGKRVLPCEKYFSSKQITFMKQFREKTLVTFLWSNDFYVYKGIPVKKSPKR